MIKDTDGYESNHIDIVDYTVVKKETVKDPDRVPQVCFFGLLASAVGGILASIAGDLHVPIILVIVLTLGTGGSVFATFMSFNMKVERNLCQVTYTNGKVLEQTFGKENFKELQKFCTIKG